MRKITPVKSEVDRSAFTIDEFCVSHRLSRATLYSLWEAGTGPRLMDTGTTKKLISIEAAADWRRACETAAAAKPAH
jgi:hypothetical protein